MTATSPRSGHRRMAFGLFCISLAIVFTFPPVQAGELEDLNTENARLNALLLNEQTKNKLAEIELTREKNASANKKEIAANESAEEASKADREYADLAAITKAAGQLGSPVGIDGTVTIAASTTGILLEARSKGPEAIKTVVGLLCTDLNALSISGVLPIPVTAFNSISEAKMRHAQLDSVLKDVRARIAVGGTKTMGFSGEALAFAKSAEVLYGSARTVAKFFMTDRNITFGETPREALFSGALGMKCKSNIANPKLQFQAGRTAKGQIDALAAALDELEEFRTQTAQDRAVFDSTMTDLKADLAAAKESKVSADIQTAEAALKKHAAKETVLLGDEILATRAGALDYGFGTKAAVTISDLAWLEVDKQIGTMPVMTYELSVQDVQEIRKRWWGTRVKYRTSVELVYQVVDSAGKILAADGISYTSKEGTL